jgi:hypothetical protein
MGHNQMSRAAAQVQDSGRTVDADPVLIPPNAYLPPTPHVFPRIEIAHRLMQYGPTVCTNKPYHAHDLGRVRTALSTIQTICLFPCAYAAKGCARTGSLTLMRNV